MGFLGDLRYFGPRLGPNRAVRLVAAKLSKTRRKRRLAADLARPTPPDAVCRGLGLSKDPHERVATLRSSWEQLAAATLPSLPDPDTARRHADAVLAGRQHLFDQDPDVGWPPNWNWRWDGTDNAARFRDDIRSTWELQRLQGLLPLAVAARALASEADAEAWFTGVESFAAAHPGPGGVAWESALELGLRCLALVQGLVLLAPTEAFATRHLNVLTVLERHLRWLEADLSLDKVVRGNHLLGELAGLIAGRLLFAADTGNLETARRSLDLLHGEITAQFHPDGVNVEQSLTYEAFILEFLVVPLAMADTLGRAVPAATRDRLTRAAHHLECCTAPDGSLPRVGDADSGRGAVLAPPKEALPGLLERVRRLGGPGPAASGGPSGEPALPRIFPDGGHVTWTPAPGAFLFLRGGPFGWGLPGPASHSHADLLAPVLYLGGEPLLVDPGVFGYRIGADRDADRVRGAHSALDPGASVGPFPAGTFRWAGIPEDAKVHSPAPDRVQGTVPLAGPNGPLIWQRSIRYNQLDETWIILDRLQGNPPGPVTWGFRFAPGIHIESETEGVYRVRLASGRTLDVRLEPVGETWVEDAWVAPAYGRRVQAPVLRRRIEGAFEETAVTFTPRR